MQIRYEQLKNQLEKNLAGFYWINGDIPLLMQEACDLIRKFAAHKGFQERKSFNIDNAFSWQDFLLEYQSLSLFSEKQLIELRFNQNSVNEKAREAIKEYCAHPHPEKLLLITTEKVDYKSQQTVWFQNLVKHAMFIQLWPLERAQLPQWVTQRLAMHGLSADNECVQLLSEYAEGNLLAAAQDIEKLALLYGSKKLILEDIQNVVSDTSRFDIFTLCDACLQGDGKRLLKILSRIHSEGIEPPLVLWALTRDLRILIKLAYAVKQNEMPEKILQQNRVMEKRKLLFKKALQRHNLESCQKFIEQAFTIDEHIKGVKSGNVWDQFETLGLAIAGISTC